jgi:CDP-glycerol glycerophosphotransferase (TagB/SpsB family)
VAYRDLVDTVVDICEQQEWELVIKLHPIEGSEQYEQWGYDEYITDKTDIETLLLRSDIAVTDLSSAFIESISLGTPIVVTQSSATMDLEPLHRVVGLAFPDSLAEAREDITELKGSHVSVDDIAASGLINLGGSCERIHEITVGGPK